MSRQVQVAEVIVIDSSCDDDSSSSSSSSSSEEEEQEEEQQQQPGEGAAAAARRSSSSGAGSGSSSSSGDSSTSPTTTTSRAAAAALPDEDDGPEDEHASHSPSNHKIGANSENASSSSSRQILLSKSKSNSNSNPNSNGANRDVNENKENITINATTGTSTGAASSSAAAAAAGAAGAAAQNDDDDNDDEDNDIDDDDEDEKMSWHADASSHSSLDRNDHDNDNDDHDEQRQRQRPQQDSYQYGTWCSDSDYDIDIDSDSDDSDQGRDAQERQFLRDTKQRLDRQEEEDFLQQIENELDQQELLLQQQQQATSASATTHTNTNSSTATATATASTAAVSKKRDTDNTTKLPLLPPHARFSDPAYIQKLTLAAKIESNNNHNRSSKVQWVETELDLYYNNQNQNQNQNHNTIPTDHDDVTIPSLPLPLPLPLPAFTEHLERPYDANPPVTKIDVADTHGKVHWIQNQIPSHAWMQGLQAAHKAALVQASIEKLLRQGNNMNKIIRATKEFPTFLLLSSSSSSSPRSQHPHHHHHENNQDVMATLFQQELVQPFAETLVSNFGRNGADRLLQGFQAQLVFEENRTNNNNDNHNDNCHESVKVQVEAIHSWVVHQFLHVLNDHVQHQWKKQALQQLMTDPNRQQLQVAIPIHVFQRHWRDSRRNATVPTTNNKASNKTTTTTTAATAAATTTTTTTSTTMTTSGRFQEIAYTTTDGKPAVALWIDLTPPRIAPSSTLLLDSDTNTTHNMTEDRDKQLQQELHEQEKLFLRLQNTLSILLGGQQAIQQRGLCLAISHLIDYPSSTGNTRKEWQEVLRSYCHDDPIGHNSRRGTSKSDGVSTTSASNKTTLDAILVVSSHVNLPPEVSNKASRSMESELESLPKHEQQRTKRTNTKRSNATDSNSNTVTEQQKPESQHPREKTKSSSIMSLSGTSATTEQQQREIGAFKSARPPPVSVVYAEKRSSIGETNKPNHESDENVHDASSSVLTDPVFGTPDDKSVGSNNNNNINVNKVDQSAGANKNEAFANFKSKYNAIYDIEYQRTPGLKYQCVISSMWKRHKTLFGKKSHCTDDCECVYRIDALTENVVREFLDKELRQNAQKGKQTKEQANHNLQNPEDTPVGFVKRFAPKFLPLLKERYPDENPAHILKRVIKMWDLHLRQAMFGNKCRVDCMCGAGWKRVFNHGDVFRKPASSSQKGAKEDPMKNMSVPRRKRSQSDLYNTEHASVGDNSSATEQQPPGKKIATGISNSKVVGLSSSVSSQQGKKEQNRREPLPVYCTYNVRQALGFYCNTDQNEKKCVLTSICPTGQTRKKYPIIEEGALVLSVELQQGSKKHKYPVHGHEELKNFFIVAREWNSDLKLSLLNAKQKSGAANSSDSSADWTINGKWRGKDDLGWPGGIDNIVSPATNPDVFSRAPPTKAGHHNRPPPPRPPQKNDPKSNCTAAVAAATERIVLAPVAEIRKPGHAGTSITISILRSKANGGPRRNVRFDTNNTERYYDPASTSVTLLEQRSVASSPSLEKQTSSSENIKVSAAVQESVDTLVESVRRNDHDRVLRELSRRHIKTDHVIGTGPNAENLFEREYKFAKERGFQLIAKILTVYRAARSAIDAAQSIKSWCRYDISIEKIDGIRLKSLDHRSTSVEARVTHRIQINKRGEEKSQTLSTLPERDFLNRSVVEYGPGDSSTYSIHYNPLLSEGRTIVIELQSTLDGCSLASAYLPVKEISTLCDQTRASVAFEKEFLVGELLEQGLKVHVRARKCNVAPEYLAGKTQKVCEEITAVLNWIQRFNSENGVCDPYKLTPNMCGRHNFSLLHSAVLFEQPILVRRLVSLGADPGIKSPIGSALVYAMNLADRAKEKLNHESNGGTPVDKERQSRLESQVKRREEIAKFLRDTMMSNSLSAINEPQADHKSDNRSASESNLVAEARSQHPENADQNHVDFEGVSFCKLLVSAKAGRDYWILESKVANAYYEASGGTDKYEYTRSRDHAFARGYIEYGRKNRDLPGHPVVLCGAECKPNLSPERFLRLSQSGLSLAHDKQRVGAAPMPPAESSKATQESVPLVSSKEKRKIDQVTNPEQPTTTSKRKANPIPIPGQEQNNLVSLPPSDIPVVQKGSARELQAPPPPRASQLAGVLGGVGKFTAIASSKSADEDNEALSNNEGRELKLLVESAWTEEGSWLENCQIATNFYRKRGASDKKTYLTWRRSATARGFIKWGRRHLNEPGTPIRETSFVSKNDKTLSFETYLSVTSSGLDYLMSNGFDPSQEMEERARAKKSPPQPSNHRGPPPPPRIQARPPPRLDFQAPPPFNIPPPPRRTLMSSAPFNIPPPPRRGSLPPLPSHHGPPPAGRQHHNHQQQQQHHHQHHQQRHQQQHH